MQLQRQQRQMPAAILKCTAACSWFQLLLYNAASLCIFFLGAHAVIYWRCSAMLQVVL
jgi:hypothetical protein